MFNSRRLSRLGSLPVACDISGAMENANDFDAVPDDPVEDDIGADSEAAQFRGQFFAPTSHLGQAGQRLALPIEGRQDFLRRVRIALGDMEADLDEIARGPRGG